ncbi:MAG: YidB family protein [Acidobacteriota bacterium]|nr:YidB family protein [Acidobacteriota bacterium]
MTIFDSIIAQADEQFNLGGKAGTLLSALLALMTDGTRGGLAGFTERFNQAGLDDTASSWITSSANTEISNEQLESALGMNTLRNIAAQTGTEYDTTVSAAAFMTPRVVDALTPEGTVPPDGDLMSRIGGFLTDTTSATSVTTAETFDRVGTAAVETLDANKGNVAGVNAVSGENYPVGNRVDSTLDKVESAADNPSPLQWLLPLLLLGLLLVIGYWSCSKPPTSPASASVNLLLSQIKPVSSIRQIPFSNLS